MNSSSSCIEMAPRMVPVLFLIAMDEQTVSLILPYQRANWLPQNSPELSQPTAGAGDGGFVHIWRGKDLLPGMDACVWGVRNSLLEFRVLGIHRQDAEK